MFSSNELLFNGGKRVNGTLKVVEKKVKVDTEQRGVYHWSRNSRNIDFLPPEGVVSKRDEVFTIRKQGAKDDRMIT